MKKILCFFSMLALLFSCSDEEVTGFSEANVTHRNVTVEATLPNASGFGMKTAMTKSDIIRVQYVKADGTATGRLQTLYCQEAQGAKGTFAAKGVAVPNDAAKAVLYLDNPSNSIKYDNRPAKLNLSDQAGTEAFVQQNSCIYATSEVNDHINASLAYKTAVMKVDIQLPDDADDLTGAAIKLSLEGQKLINQVDVVAAEAGANTQYGVISVQPTVVDNAAKKLTAYIMVWPEAGMFDNAVLRAQIGSTKLSGVFNAPANLTPGAINTVATTIDFDARVYDLWMNDEEHTINNVLGDYVEGPSWMKKEGTTIKIEANTTGNPRSGVLTLNNGKTYKITQIDVQDFFGTWTLWSKKFNGSKSVGGSDGNNYTEVTFGEPRKKETLPDEEGHLYTNNFGVRGLYFDTVLDGTIVIDYEAKDIKVGFFVDCREAQPTGNATYPYAVYLPEGAAAPSWGNYNFQPTDFSETDYAWWWYNLSNDLRSLKYVFVGVGQKIGPYYVCGLSITPATGPNKADITKAYDCIYQANANTSDKNGMEFIKK